MKSGTDDNDSLLLHILKNNHVEYVLNEEGSEKSKLFAASIAVALTHWSLDTVFLSKPTSVWSALGRNLFLQTQVKWEDAYSSWLPPCSVKIYVES